MQRMDQLYWNPLLDRMVVAVALFWCLEVLLGEAVVVVVSLVAVLEEMAPVLLVAVEVHIPVWVHVELVVEERVSGHVYEERELVEEVVVQ